MQFPSAKSVIEILDEKSFSFSAEIIPPRNGTDFEEVFRNIERLRDSGFDFISVTHGAGGSLRGGTLPISYHAQAQLGMTAIAHLTCRGMTREDLENLLIDHHYFGIHNILALRGDPPDGIDAKFTPVEGGFQYAYELIELIQRLNEGKYLPRKNFDDGKEFREGLRTRFCIGAACYPEDPASVRLKYLQRKKEAGAQFAITQMVLDEKIFFDYYQEVRAAFGPSFPLLPGVRVPKSFRQLERMRDKFGISVSLKLLEQMKEASSEAEASEVGIKWAIGFIEKAREMGVKGVHFFIMNDLESALRIKERIAIA